MYVKNSFSLYRKNWKNYKKYIPNFALGGKLDL